MSNPFEDDYDDDKRWLTLEAAIEEVQEVIGDWGDGGRYTEPVRLRQIFGEKLTEICDRLRKRSVPFETSVLMNNVWRQE